MENEMLFYLNVNTLCNLFAATNQDQFHSTEKAEKSQNLVKK